MMLVSMMTALTYLGWETVLTPDTVEVEVVSTCENDSYCIDGIYEEGVVHLSPIRSLSSYQFIIIS